MSATRFGHGDLIDSTQMQTDEAGAAADLNGAGSGSGPVSYTAFGEAVGVGGWGEGGAGDAGPVGDGSLHDELDTRYRFAGGYGYESAGGAAGSPAGGYGAALLALPGAWGWGASGSGYCGANPNLPPITLQHLGWRWHQADSGRFVQRDPIGVRGGMNAYNFGNASPAVAVDPEGLDRWVGGALHGAIIYETDCGCVEIGIKMEVATDDRWWHWPKDALQNGMNAAFCGSVGGVGRIYKRPVPRPQVPPTFPTSLEEDAVLDRAYFDGQCIYYNGGL